MQQPNHCEWIYIQFTKVDPKHWFYDIGLKYTWYILKHHELQVFNNNVDLFYGKKNNV